MKSYKQQPAGSKNYTPGPSRIFNTTNHAQPGRSSAQPGRSNARPKSKKGKTTKGTSKKNQRSARATPLVTVIDFTPHSRATSYRQNARTVRFTSVHLEQGRNESTSPRRSNRSDSSSLDGNYPLPLGNFKQVVRTPVLGTNEWLQAMRIRLSSPDNKIPGYQPFAPLLGGPTGAHDQATAIAGRFDGPKKTSPSTISSLTYRASGQVTTKASESTLASLAATQSGKKGAQSADSSLSQSAALQSLKHVCSGEINFDQPTKELVKEKGDLLGGRRDPSVRKCLNIGRKMYNRNLVQSMRFTQCQLKCVVLYIL